MRITAIMNLKGGVAKTTTVVNMAAILAAKGSKVLVIDGDAQCNTTEFLTEEHCLAYRTLADLLGRDKAGVMELQPTKLENVTLIPAAEDLMGLDISKAEGGKLDMDCLRFRRRWWKELGIDYVLIDCPPAFSAAAAAALLAADSVIIPMKLDAFSIRGMSVLFKQIESMREINPELTIDGILPTMWYRSQETEQIENELGRAGLPIFHHIRLSKTVDKMTIMQKPLQEMSKNSGALKDYRIFVDQYIAKEAPWNVI